MDDIYLDGKYKEANPTWHEADAPWKARQIHGILADNDVSFASACEVGCGTGEILVQLSNVYPDVEFSGYDISPHAIQMAVGRGGPTVNFYLQDILQQDGAAFDVTIVADVIEHVEDYIGFVRDVKKLGGKQVFHIPLDLSVQSIARMTSIMNLRRDVGHIHYFAKDTALALLQDCGYRIIDWRYTASRLELPNQARSSRLVAPLRKVMHRVNPDLAVRVLGGYSLLVLAE